MPSNPPHSDRSETAYESPDGPDDYLLRDALFDLLGEAYTDRAVAIVRDWLGTYERAGCSLGDAQAEFEPVA